MTSTPENWVAVHLTRVEGGRERLIGYEIYAVGRNPEGDVNAYPIAEVRGDRDRDCDQANANLMAASKVLRDALAGLRAFLPFDEEKAEITKIAGALGVSYLELDEALVKTKAALLKAEGKA